MGQATHDTERAKMPKLSKKDQKNVESAQAWGVGGFLLPEGRYAARLYSVTERPGREFDQWSWEFRQLHNEDGEPVRGRQWHNTSLSPKAAGNLKATFKAFGYSTDSDTDEIIGEWAVLHISQEIAQQGKKAGQVVNRVQGIGEFRADEWDFDIDDVPDDEAPEPVAATSGGASDDF